MSAPPVEDGRLAENVVRFVRALREAGLRLGPAASLDAVEAVRAVGLDRRDDVFWALHSTLVTRPEDDPVFEEVFQAFWRSRRLNERLIAILSPTAPPQARAQPPRAGERRAQDALREAAPRAAKAPERLTIEVDARMTSSADEVLRAKDFAQMSARELDEARRAVAALAMPDERVATRRFRAARRGRPDPRAMLRAAMRSGGDMILPAFRAPRRRVPPVVILADISGSMSRYSDMVLRFAHALTDRRRRVSTFLFGTRLSNVTRALRHRDADEAMAACSASAADWSGGTRIGSNLTRFNRDWSRRVLGQGAIVLLVTDGLERGEVEELAREADRLRRSCRRLIWLCPLLAYEDFAAKARGVRALLANVDEFRPVHSVDAIANLCATLSEDRPLRTDPRRWLAPHEKEIA